MTIKNLWTEYDGKGFSAEHADYAERATADEAGNDIASTYATKAENDAKADKVASATSGNFAGLDANGNLTDSGSKASDFATATALSTHTGNSTIHVTANDKATWTGKQNTVGTKNVTTAVDADTPIATGYSSDTISFNTAGRVATYVSSKVSSDLGITSSAYGGKAATAGSADYATTAGSAGSATNATNATNVNLTGSVKDTSTTNGDTIQVKAGSGTAAEITIVNAKHAASADSADSATTASSASSVEWAGVQNKVSASTTTVGIVQLQDSVGASESSTTTAVTPHAVRDAIDSAVASAYHHAGTKTVAQLVSTLLVPANEGNVYNITDSGTTTSNFIEGDGHPIRVGDNVGICDIGSGVYKFDLLSGFVDLSNYLQKSSTTGLVKNDGSIDTSTYLTKTGDGKDVTSTFTKNASDTSGMASGGKLSALFTAISNFFASLKALAFKATVGTDDIDDDAITAAKVKDNETLPVNVSGTAGNIAAGGTSGYYLKSNGGSTAPAWANPDDLYVGRAHNADHTYSAGDADNHGGPILVVSDTYHGYYEPYVTPNVKTYYSSSQGSSIRVGNTSGATTSDRKGSIVIGNGANAGTIFADNLTSFLEYQLPNAGGTLIPAADLGSSGQYLKSNGSSSAPTWANLPQNFASVNIDGTTVAATSASDTLKIDGAGGVTATPFPSARMVRLSAPYPVRRYQSTTNATSQDKACYSQDGRSSTWDGDSPLYVTFTQGNTFAPDSSHSMNLHLYESATESEFRSIRVRDSKVRFIKAGETVIFLRTSASEAIVIGSFTDTTSLTLASSGRVYTYHSNAGTGSSLKTYPQLSAISKDTFNADGQTLYNIGASVNKLITTESSTTYTPGLKWTGSGDYAEFVDVSLRVIARASSTRTDSRTIAFAPMVASGSTYVEGPIPELYHPCILHSASTDEDISFTMNARFQYYDLYNRLGDQNLYYGILFGVGGSQSSNLKVDIVEVWTRFTYHGGT